MQAKEYKVKISFRGIGCNVIKGTVDNETWDLILKSAKQFKTTFEYAVFDIDFFSALNLPQYKSFHDFNNICTITGLLCHSKSFIEIRINKKQRAKINSTEILNQNILFPLYNSEMIDVDKIVTGMKNITIVEEEVGTVSSFLFDCKKFEIEKLKFYVSVIKINKDRFYNIISKITYDGKNLKSSHSDTLVTGNFTFVEN